MSSPPGDSFLNALAPSAQRLGRISKWFRLRGQGAIVTGFRNKFHAGQVIHHKLFDYRGVIVGVDQTFQLSEDWYATVARSRPPKDQPWYHVLVHGAQQTTYVAERNLEHDSSGEPIDHPLLETFFDKFNGGFYSNSREEN
jgi:heat shock protein HspQ